MHALHPGLYGFKIINKEISYDTDGVLNMGGKNAPRYANLEEIINHLKKTYCGNIAAQFTHLVRRMVHGL